MNYSFIFILTLISSNLIGQQTSVFEFFNIEKEECFYENSSEYEPEIVKEYALPAQDQSVLDKTEAIDTPEVVSSELTQVLKGLKAKFAKMPKVENTRFILENGDYPFREGGLWGMNNKKGQTIVAPKFSQIYGNEMGEYAIDKTQKGFIGCIGDRCNYYQKDKKVLSEDWFYLRRVNEETFVVRGKSGFGVWQGQKMLIPADKISMKYNVFKNYQAFIFNEDSWEKSTILTNEGDVYFKSNWIEKVEYLDENYILFYGKLINRKSKKMLICDDNFSISLFHKENKLFILKYEDKQYLIDIEGNMVLKEGFNTIKTDLNNGYYRVEGYTKNSSSVKYRSLINAKGELMFPIDQYYIVKVKSGYFILQTVDNKIGLADKAGNIIIAPEKQIINVLNDSLVWMSNYEKVENSNYPKIIDAKIIRLPEGIIVSDSLIGNFLHQDTVCEKAFYYGGSGTNGKYSAFYLDTNFRRIGSPDIPSIIFNKNAENSHFFNDSRKTGKQYYDCNGELITLTIAGEDINLFRFIKRIKENLHVIGLVNGDNYFWRNDNTFQKISFPFQIVDYRLQNDQLISIKNVETKNWGLFNDLGEELLPSLFNRISLLEGENYLKFSVDDDFTQYVDMDGNLVLENWSNIKKHLIADLFVIEKNGKKGVINATGEIIIPVAYKYCGYNKGLLISATDKERFYYSCEGKLVSRKKKK